MVVVLGLAACMPRPGNTGGDNPNAAASATGPAITLERTACFGSCPVYRIAVSPGGMVTFEGRANVRHPGTASAQIPPDTVEALLRELEQAGYFTFAHRYALSEPTCRRHSTDSPTAISSATYKGRSQRIEHDYGCGGVPGALTVMEKRIDEVLGSGRWTGR